MTVLGYFSPMSSHERNCVLIADTSQQDAASTSEILQKDLSDLRLEYAIAVGAEKSLQSIGEGGQRMTVALLDTRIDEDMRVSDALTRKGVGIIL